MIVFTVDTVVWRNKLAKDEPSECRIQWICYQQLCGQPLPSICLSTGPVTGLTISSNHAEEIHFFPSLTLLILLWFLECGHPWLSRYPFSAIEREAMVGYISDSLAVKLIRTSSSPAGAIFFFVEKKDGSLYPCINYQGLNDITVRCHWCRRPLSICKSWIFAMLTIWSILGKVMSGRLLSTPQGTFWISGDAVWVSQCPCSLPGSHQWHTEGLGGPFLFCLLIYIYWFFLHPSRNIPRMSVECFRACWKMGCLSRQRNASFMHSLFNSWGTSFWMDPAKIQDVVNWLILGAAN